MTVCDLGRQAKVMVLPKGALFEILRGDKRLANLPGDASLIAIEKVGADFGLRIHSARFSPVPHGHILPLMLPVLEINPDRAR